MATVSACLQALGANAATWTGALTVDEEFTALKRLYFKTALRLHPDKGGNAEQFSALQQAWEGLRGLYDAGKVQSFDNYLPGAAGANTASFKASRAVGDTVPSWEWFAEAAADDAGPLYRVEPARSGRSKCGAKGAACQHAVGKEFIAQGEVRVGSYDENTGGYARWTHLCCWRVPSSIWLGLPSGFEAKPSLREEAAFEDAVLAMQSVTFIGYSELDADQKAAVLARLMNKDNWAKLVDKKKAAPAAKKAKPGKKQKGGGEATAAADALAVIPDPGSTGSGSTAVGAAGGAARGTAFVLPRPGMNGARAGAFAGQTFVLTGTFPEVGGGAGLLLGKARVEEWIELFGGRITSAVSGKTSYVVIGKAPGATKVKAAQRGGVRCVMIVDLVKCVESHDAALESAPPPIITDYSTGYGGKVKPTLMGTGTFGQLEEKEKAPRIKAPRKRKAKKEPSYDSEEEAAEEDWE